MPKFEQPDQGELNFDPKPAPQKRYDFFADYTADDRSRLASRISTLLGQGVPLESLTEEEQAYYKWQKEAFDDDDSQPKWSN